MTKDQAIKKLGELTDHDPEASHSTADKVILAYLRSNDGVEVAEAWVKACNSVGFWYS